MTACCSAATSARPSKASWPSSTAPDERGGAMHLFQGNWWLMLLGILAFVLIAWWGGFNSRRTRVERSRPADVLDEGAARAQRNQALIDAPARPAAMAMPEGAPERAAATAEGGDDLTRIKGLGPKLAALLHTLGVTSIAQIAAWCG